jgi:hypothetical protein
MRGWTKWAIGSVAALGLLVGAAGPAGAGARPAGGHIAGSFAGEGDFVNDPCAIPEVTDTIGIGVSFTATGDLSSLGASDIEGIVCLDPRDGRAFGPLTLSSERGTITGDMDGGAVESPELNPFPFALESTVTDGTGRFAGASGTLSVEVTIRLTGPIQVEGTIDGTVTVPPRTPTSAADCKHGGWRHLVDDHGRPFRSQGACIRWVRHHAGGSRAA